jgi:hypothetical protein
MRRALGYGNWLSRPTAGQLRGARIAGCVAFADFRSFPREIPIEATQLTAVDGTVHSFDGSRAARYQWLHRGVRAT